MEKSIHYCPNCGTQNPESAKICANCNSILSDLSSKEMNNTAPASFTSQQIGEGTVDAQIVYADFGNRLVAYILDSILMGIVGGLLSTLWGAQFNFFGLGGNILEDSWPSVGTGFLYFFLMEYFNKGQTLGKMILKIRTVSIRDNATLTPAEAALHSLFKALLLGLDVIIGLIATDKSTPETESMVRFTQRFSKTVVIKV